MNNSSQAEWKPKFDSNKGGFEVFKEDKSAVIQSALTESQLAHPWSQIENLVREEAEQKWMQLSDQQQKA